MTRAGFFRPFSYSDYYRGVNMKRFLSVFLALILTFTAIPAAVYADTNTQTAIKTASKVTVDGVVKDFDAYTINENNYFKLRDIAYILSGTNKQFGITWDGTKQAINMVRGNTYIVVGGEMVPSIGASTKTATLSTSSIYLDDNPVKLTAYTINQNNYFMLRDLGKLLDFGVEWDGKNNTVAILSTTGYTNETSDEQKPVEETPKQEEPKQQEPVQKPEEQQPVEQQPKPEAVEPPLTAEGIYASMIALKTDYPEGMRWTNDNFYAWNGGIYSGGYGCAGFAFMLSDAAFGNRPGRMHEDFGSIRVGDIVRINNDTHSVIVLSVENDGVIIAEGNYNSSIHWGRKLDWSKITSATYVITRYPQ